jgi:hypothetical protein
MTHYKKLKLSALLFALGLLTQAQEAPTAAGGDATGSGGTVAYSVGQVSYVTNTGTNGTEGQGVQQPYEILTTSVENAQIAVSLSAFPNPALNTLNLQVANFANQKMTYSLFDVQGKLLESKSIAAQQTQIDMSALSAASYFITVLQDDKKIRSFKIIKK